MSTAFFAIAYDLKIASPFPLPELWLDGTDDPSRAFADGDALGTPAPDVAVSIAPVVVRGKPSLIDDGCAFWAAPGQTILQYDGVGRFCVTGGTRIEIQPDANADQRELRFFVLGPALAVLLQQRGLLVLHGNCVRIGEVAALFTGFSGRGKSTMAATLCARGHALVCDDITPIDLSRNRPMARPGFPQIRLLPESIAALGGQMDGPTLHPRSDKFGWRVCEGFARQPVPLSHIYLLDFAASLSINTLTPGDAFGHIVASTYPVVARLMQFTGSTGAHFRQCVKLASKVSTARLLRPRSLDLLPDVARMIEAQAATVPTHQSGPRSGATRVGATAATATGDFN